MKVFEPLIVSVPESEAMVLAEPRVTLPLQELLPLMFRSAPPLETPLLREARFLLRDRGAILWIALAFLLSAAATGFGIAEVRDQRATIAALQGMGAGRNILLIAGGQGKGADFTQLQAAVADHCKALVLFHREGPDCFQRFPSGIGQGVLCKQVPAGVTSEAQLWE